LGWLALTSKRRKWVISLSTSQCTFLLASSRLRLLHFVSSLRVTVLCGKASGKRLREISQKGGESTMARTTYQLSLSADGNHLLAPAARASGERAA